MIKLFRFLKGLPRPARLAAAALAVLLALFASAVSINEAVRFSDSFPTWSGQNGSGIPAGGQLSGAQVHFIDVGQGDCTLILTDDFCILADCGEYDSAGAVIRYLNALGIKRIDLLIMSHPHSDHMGCMYRIAEKYEIGEFMMPDIPEDMIPRTSPYSRLMEILDKKSVPVTYAIPGKVTETGSKGTLEVIAPVGKYEDLNDYSAVVKFTFGEVRFLLCGDIEKEAEQDILGSGADVGADVIKVPHHGSGTSSTKAFVMAVGAKYAVFCAGEDNEFGHPHANIVALYEKTGAGIIRTDINGNILFRTDGTSTEVITEKNTTGAAAAA